MHRKKLQTIRVVSFTILSVALIFLVTRVRDDLHKLGNVLAASSPWIQTDWSGGVSSGVVTSTVNTYESEVDIDTASVNGEILIGSETNWSSNLSDWNHRSPININNPGGVLSEFQVLVKLNTTELINNNKLKSNCDDVRFTNNSGQALYFFQATPCNALITRYWVKVDTILENSDTVIYFYYGNPNATNLSDRDNTLEVDLIGTFFDSTYDANLPNHGASSDRENNFYISQNTYVNRFNNNWSYLQKYSNLDIYTGLCFDDKNNRFYGIDWNNKQWSTFNLDFQEISPQDNFVGNQPIDCATDSNYIYTNHRNGLICRNNILDNTSSCFNMSSLAGFNWGGQGMTYGFGYLFAGTSTYGQNTNRIYMIDIDDWNNPIIVDYWNANNHNLTEVAGLTWNGKYIYQTSRSQNYVNKWQGPVKVSTNEPSVGVLGQEENRYKSSGYLTSNVFDAGVPIDWGTINFSEGGTGTVTVKARSSINSDMTGATDWASCSGIASGTDLSTTGCVSDSDRYIQYQIILGSTGIVSPIFNDISIAFVPSDQVPPDVNATDVAISGLTNSGDWYATEPTITWTEGVDDLNGNGILGHCVAIDEAEPDSSNGLNPAMASGVLTGKNDGVAQDYCPYIVVGDQFDVSGVSGLDLTSGKQYYISIKAVDIAGNIYTGTDETWKDLLSFKYDNQAPTAPFYISLPANFLSSKDVVVTWPVGVGGADDLHSGLAGLQYRVGDSGTWYGDLHTGTEDINDLLINDGSYVTDETYDYPELVEGNNLIYVRAVDNLGNVTAPENYVKGLLKLNTVAPSPVRNLTVNPLNSEENAYTFTWDVPSTYTGSSAGITYCYAVNAIPSVSNCTFTEAGVTSLGPDAFATQPGENTMYVVAKDEAGNINYATYSEPGSSVTYTYSGTAPGITQNLDVADISVKATENWRLVLSWDQPTNVGAGISYYNIYRSGTTSSCNGNFAAFTKVGSSTSTSYIDPNLEQKLYNYCIKACDSANNCSASSGTVGRLPTGKFTEPAELLSPPEVVSFTTRKAVINWITDRVSDSSVQYGLESGVYFEAELSNSNQLAVHTIPLDNLEPGTTYFYRAKWTDVDGNTGVSEEKTFATLPPPRVLEVKVSDIRTDSALVTFTVSSATSVELLYGETVSYGGTITTPTSTLESTYSTRISNLREDTIYNFRFTLLDIESNNYDIIQNNRFTTLPIPRVQDIQVQEVKNSAQPTVDVNWTSNVPIGTQVTYYPLDNIDQKRDKLDVELKTEHEISISELQPNRRYGMIITGRDAIGNQAESDEYQFTTAADSRPPAISNIKVETRVSNTSTGEQAQTQLIITWDTDEESTSQIEYGEGANGTYTQRSLVDDNLTFNHLVIVNNLRPSSVYHFRVVSADSAGNESTGKNVVTITAQVSENPLDIIISRLTEVFGFIR